jgi:hypothetical protein
MVAHAVASQTGLIPEVEAPDRSIAAIELGSGLRDLGRFSQIGLRAFGEDPGETAAATRPKPRAVPLTSGRRDGRLLS